MKAFLFFFLLITYPLSLNTFSVVVKVVYPFGYILIQDDGTSGIRP